MKIARIFGHRQAYDFTAVVDRFWDYRIQVRVAIDQFVEVGQVTGKLLPQSGRLH